MVLWQFWMCLINFKTLGNILAFNIQGVYKFKRYKKMLKIVIMNVYYDGFRASSRASMVYPLNRRMHKYFGIVPCYLW